MEPKLTPHRQAVLDIVKASTDHPTARDVFDRTSRLAASLSFATVYNALNYLTDQGFVRVIRFGDDAVRYDPMVERHDHLLCRGCGAIFDAVGLEAPSLPPGVAAPRGFEVEEVMVQFHGVCAACRGRRKGAGDGPGPARDSFRKFRHNHNIKE